MKIKKNGKVINLTESDLKRIVKKILNEENESTYTLMSSGNATPAEIAEAMEGAIGRVNNDEAVMQAAISAIKDMGVFKSVSNILGQDVVNWLIKEYSTDKDDYKTDKYGNNKFPTIYDHLDELGVIRDLDNNNRASLSSVIQDTMWVKTNQPGDTYNP